MSTEERKSVAWWTGYVLGAVITAAIVAAAVVGLIKLIASS